MKKHLLLAAAIVILSLLIAVPVINQFRIDAQQKDEAHQVEVDSLNQKNEKLQDDNQKLRQQNKKKEDKIKGQDKQIEQLNNDLQAKRDREAQEAQLAAAQSYVSPGGNCEAYRPLVEQYDWDVPTMMRIMFEESGCDPVNHNHGDNHGSCLGSYGLFQVGCVHGYSIAHLENPANNVAAAYSVWGGGNYGAWTTY